MKVSFEIVPPIKSTDGTKLVNTLRRLEEYAPSFVSITAHNPKSTLVELEGGVYKKELFHKRPSQVATLHKCLQESNVEVVPHIISTYGSTAQIESLLVDYAFMGIKTVMLLRGDDGVIPAKDLVVQVNNMNKGVFQNPVIKDEATSFKIGVAGYPERHFRSPNYEQCLISLKDKVDAGADFIITQMCFNPFTVIKFCKDCRDIGINVPIIPGIKILSDRSQVYSIPRSFGVEIPLKLQMVLESDNAKEAGVEYVKWMIDEFQNFGLDNVHIFTYHNLELIDRLFNKM